LIVGNLGQGMRSCKCTNHDLYGGGCRWQWKVCDRDTMVIVCMSGWVCVCVSLQLLSFKFSSGCLFNPHHVNQGPVQKPTPQVTLYEPHTSEESLRRRRSGRNNQVLSGHPGHAMELLHVLLPPHQRFFFPSFVFFRGFKKLGKKNFP
jgi:hypothetical protein